MALSSQLQTGHVSWEGCEILCSFSSGSPRPLLPAQFQRQVFFNIHSLAHPSVRATRCLVSARFVWPGLARDVQEWCRDYQGCQTGKVTCQLGCRLTASPSRRGVFLMCTWILWAPCQRTVLGGATFSP